MNYLKAHLEIQVPYCNKTPLDFLTDFIFYNEKDCMFLNWEERKACFDTVEFIELLKITKEYMQGQTEVSEVQEVEMLRNGSCLGRIEYVVQPYQVGIIDARMGETVN